MHGSQPMEMKPRSWSGLWGTPFSRMKSHVWADVHRASGLSFTSVAGPPAPGNVRSYSTTCDVRTRRRALVAALARGPRAQGAQLSPQRLHFAHTAALFVAVFVEAEEALLPDELLQGRGLGRHEGDLDLVSLPHGLEEPVRLRVQPARVEAEDGEGQAALARHVHEHHVFGAAEREGERRAPPLETPAQDGRGVRVGELARRRLDLGGGDFDAGSRDHLDAWTFKRFHELQDALVDRLAPVVALHDEERRELHAEARAEDHPRRGRVALVGEDAPRRCGPRDRATLRRSSAWAHLRHGSPLTSRFLTIVTCMGSRA